MESVKRNILDFIDYTVQDLKSDTNYDQSDLIEYYKSVFKNSIHIIDNGLIINNGELINPFNLDEYAEFTDISRDKTYIDIFYDDLYDHSSYIEFNNIVPAYIEIKNNRYVLHCQLQVETQNINILQEPDIVEGITVYDCIENRCLGTFFNDEKIKYYLSL